MELSSKFFNSNISELNKPGEPLEECDKAELNNDIDKNLTYKLKRGTKNVSDVRLEMQKVMQKHAGVFRNDKLLAEGVEKMKKIYKEH